MEIAGILTAGKYVSSALEQLGKSGPSQETTLGQASETAATAASTGVTSVLREIAAEYDVTDISPREFSEMIGKLYEAGTLSDQQYQDLSQVRADLDLEGVDPDETLNLVEFYVDKLRELCGSLDDADGGSGSISAKTLPEAISAQRRLAWLEKLAAIQAEPDSTGLDTTA